MPTLYELQSGKITRRNSKGEVETHKAPYKFVPSPSELAANKFRMQPAGTVPDTSDEAKAALQNTNTPQFRTVKQTITPSLYPQAQAALAESVAIQADTVAVSQASTVVALTVDTVDIDDIRRVKDIHAVLGVIKAVTAESALDKFLLQESENKPRPRKKVLTAIEERRDELTTGVT